MGLGFGLRELIDAPQRVVGACVHTGADFAATAVVVAAEVVGGVPPRPCARHDDRVWLAVRHLDGPCGPAVEQHVHAAVSALPGVTRVELHRPLGRVVVWVEPERPSPRELSDAVAAAERAALAAGPDDSRRSPSVPPARIPGDGVILVERTIGIAAAALGVGVAVAGRGLRVPPFLHTVAASVIVVDNQPRLRKFLEARLGSAATDLALAVGTSAANVLFDAPAPVGLMVDVVLRCQQTAEAWSGRRAWGAHEPALLVAGGADPAPQTAQRARPEPLGPVERHADRAGIAQLVGALAVGAATGDLAQAGTAALVATPKPTRTTRESFAATLGRGLADRHGVLAMRPAALRRLDRVDTVVIDPRLLLTDDLTVARVRGVRDRDRVALWERARDAVDRGRLGAGWHSASAFSDGVPGGNGASFGADAQVLVSPARHRFAAALVAEARRVRARLVSLDDEHLGALRAAFDELGPMDGSVDAALHAVVDRLQRDGATVAVVAAPAPHAFALADLAIGLFDDAPPWGADVFVPDLACVWRILHALPAARSASQRGVQLATAASLLGALLMLPGVRGRGPGPVSVGSATGLMTGYFLARGVVNAEAPAPAPQQEWHAMTAAQARRALPARDSVRQRAAAAAESDPATGAVGRRLSAGARYTWDFLMGMRAELNDPLTPVQATGSAASALLGSPIDAALVGTVLVGNAALSAGQRLHAERLLNRLLAVQTPRARCVVDYRDDEGTGDSDEYVGVDSDEYVGVEASDLVAGDVVEMRPGEVVPADCRLLRADGLEVDESSLTGESLPVTKHTDPTPGAQLAERTCMVFAGTTVLSGTATGVVTAVGADTASGRAAALQPAVAQEVGLQAQLSRLTNRALPVSAGGGALVTALGLLRGTGLRQAVTSGVAVAIAAIPEGLPLVATLAQQAAARRLTRSSALVRTPSSVEALGRVQVVCFDKTGTLSENKLRVVTVRAAPGFTPDDVLGRAVRSAVAGNGRKSVHATDVAIVEAAGHLDTPLASEEDRLPFRAGRSFAAAIADGHLAVKGAPEVVLASCASAVDDLADQVDRMAADGLRVIAVAERDVTASEVRAARADAIDFDALCRQGLRPIGLLGIADTPRRDAAALLSGLAERDIAVRLITGDHPATAAAVATELGMSVTRDSVVTGADWDRLAQRDREEAVAACAVFARMSPENKVEIVQALERTGHVCAMVGDGANDAAAIRAASVGIGVSARGSDPARNAADVMLLDGRILALLDAVEEGRQLWRRVQAGVAVLLGGNAGEVAFSMVGSVLSGRSPLNTRQLLVVNMLTDALPAAALAVSPGAHEDAGAGRGPDQAALWRTVAIRGATTAAGATTAWALASITGRQRRAATIGLVALVGTQLGQTLLDSRSPLVVTTALGSMGVLAAIVNTPGVSQVFGCTPLGPVGWTHALGSAAAATTLAAVAPALVTRWFGPDSDADSSTMESTPTRTSSAYTSRNGGTRNEPTTSVSGSEPTLILTSGFDMAPL